MTRRLGLRYLWIDSLCIIQDSLKDWRQEASKMAFIYKHATIVIAASRARDAYDGLFTDFLSKYKTITLNVTPRIGAHVEANFSAEEQEEYWQDQMIYVRRTCGTRILTAKWSMVNPQGILSLPGHGHSRNGCSAKGSYTSATKNSCLNAVRPQPASAQLRFPHILISIRCLSRNQRSKGPCCLKTF